MKVLVVYTFIYTECSGYTFLWNYTYTIERNDFTVPADGGETVACPVDASVGNVPQPTVFSDCDEFLAGQYVGDFFENDTYDGCEGTINHTWLYTDCEGNFHYWTYTFTVERLDFTLPANGSATVQCAVNAVAPDPPLVNDNCGFPIIPSGPVPGGTYQGCEGTITYTWTYTDCELNTHNWVYTFMIDHTTPPVVPPNGSSTVACPEDATPPAPAFIPIYNYIGTLGGHNYYISGIPLDWQSAKNAAMFGGGHLATISSAAENALIAAAIPSALFSTAWIGLTDEATENTFLWVDGTPFGYSNWSIFEPNNLGGNEHYTQMYPDGTWNDLDGSQVYQFIVEIDVTIPVVVDVCGAPITPTGPVIGGTYEDCEGTISYTYTYTDCSGLSTPWTYTYTIEREDFTMPENEGSTVACPVFAIQPIPPVVYDNCGNLIIPSGPIEGGTYTNCEGTITYTWNYEDCEGNNHDWVYTYTIEREDFFVPEGSVSTVECLDDATEPTPPLVLDHCGNVITPSDPETGGTYEGCEGTYTYTFTYTDCEGNTHPWVYTYFIDHVTPPSEMGGPVPTASTIECPDQAVAPVLPMVKDVCGNLLSPMAFPPVISSPIVLEYYERFVTYTGVSINGGGNVMTVSPGSSVGLEYDMSVDFDEFGGYCTGCIVQTYIGLGYTNATLQCEWFIGDGYFNSYNGSFTAPTTPGVYFLVQNGTLDYVCQPQNFINTYANAIGAIIVGGTYDGCEGTIVLPYHYEDCSGLPFDWAYTYTVEVEDFTVPENGASTIECEEDATLPVPPVVTDNCGNVLTPTGPVVSGTYVSCEGTIIYTWTYTDCEGNTHNWSFTYTVDHTIAPSEEGGPVPTSSTVECIEDAVLPTLPVVTTYCAEGAPSVLLVHAVDDDYLLDVQTKLVATGSFSSVDVFNARFGTPTLAQLQGYNAVMCFSDYSYFDQNGLGDVLADYIDGGGGVVSSLFNHTTFNNNSIGGDFNTPTYLIFSPANFTTSQTYLGTVYLPLHPLMDGVASFDGGSSSFRGSGNTLVAGYRVADWTDGNFLLAARDDAGMAGDKKRVDINFYPPSSDARSDFWDVSTDGVQMMKNAIYYVASATYGSDLVATDTVVTDSPEELTCEGTRTYTLTYEDCSGLEFVWTYTYTIDHVTPPVVPANGTATVACPDDAVAPLPYSTPAGFSYIGTLGGHNYYLSDAGTDWVSAQAAAVVAGGHLATISSAAENNLVAAVVPGAGGFAWIGLSDAAVEGTYVWVDGSPFGNSHNGTQVNLIIIWTRIISICIARVTGTIWILDQHLGILSRLMLLLYLLL